MSPRAPTRSPLFSSSLPWESASLYLCRCLLSHVFFLFRFSFSVPPLFLFLSKPLCLSLGVRCVHSCLCSAPCFCLSAPVGPCYNISVYVWESVSCSRIKALCYITGTTTERKRRRRLISHSSLLIYHIARITISSMPASPSASAYACQHPFSH